MSTSMDVDVSSVNNEVSSVNDPKPFVPFTGPGSVYKVFEQYNKSKYNASGEEPIFIKPDPVSKKNKAIN